MFTNMEFKILEFFFNNFENNFTASEIANKFNFNQNIFINYLNVYLKKKIFTYKFQGRNKLFSFNLNNIDLIYNLNLQVEIEKTNLFLEKNFKIREILKKLNEKNMIIFGSYAKNLQKKDSDLDIFIVGKYDKKKVEYLSEFYDLEINVHSILKNKFKKVLNEKQILLNEIVLNHIIVDGFDFYVNSFLKYYYNIKDGSR